MASTSNPWFREKNLYKAQMAIEAGRFGDSVQFMIEIVKTLVPWTELSLSERKFLYTALMKFFEEYRQALNDVNYISFDLDGVQSEIAKFYSKEITEQMMSACKEMKHFIYSWLIHSTRSAEAKVFYLTLNADVSCFLVELQDDEEVQAMGDAVILAYKEAKAEAKAKLTWASPARLALALHRSEFYTEILQMPEKGVNIARKALARAVVATGTLTVEESLEVNELMSKLHEYIMIWSNDEDEEEGDSASLDEFLTGAILGQEDWPPDTSDDAATFITQPDAIDATTTGTKSALQSKPGAKARTSSSSAKFVVENILPQVSWPPDISDYMAIPFRTELATEEVETSGTISALQSEPGVEAGTSEIFSVPEASKKDSERPPRASPPPPPPALQEQEPGENL